MNEYDSEKIVDLMVANGYERTEKVDEADLVVLNTCSIREKSQEKVFSELGRIRDAKKEAHKDDMLIAVGGWYSLNWDAFAMLRKKPTKTIC